MSRALVEIAKLTVDLTPRRPWDSPDAPLPYWVMTWVV